MQEYSRLCPSVSDEKSLQAWAEDLLKIALALDWKEEARERQSIEKEDSNSQGRHSRDMLRERTALSPFPNAAH